MRYEAASMAGEELLLPHYSSLTGAWILDLSRSSSMSDYLRILETPETTIQAQAEAERNRRSRNVIALADSKLAVYKDTAVNNFTEIFELGQEHLTQSISGVVKRSTASLIHDGELTGYVVAARILPPDGRDLSLVDVRRLRDGGHVHAQEVTIKNNTTGAQCTTMRTWVRVPMKNSDLQHLGRLLRE